MERLEKGWKLYVAEVTTDSSFHPNLTNLPRK